MAWIRLSDDYNDHPKFSHLSDGAFRLWHQAMGFCRKYQTDGQIPMTTLRGFKAYSPKRMRELTTPWKDGENPLWYQRGEGWGIVVHDYLEWNPSKEEDAERRAESKVRMRIARERRVTHGVAPLVAAQPRANTSQTSCSRSPDVPGRDGYRNREVLEKGSGEKPDDVGLRAGDLLRKYRDWFEKERGAKTVLIGNSLEFQDAVRLVETWDDARLEKLARIVLTTDDDWIAKTDRGFKIFCIKASWADDRLSAWEAQQKKAV